MSLRATMLTAASLNASFLTCERRAVDAYGCIFRFIQSSRGFTVRNAAQPSVTEGGLCHFQMQTVCVQDPALKIENMLI